MKLDGITTQQVAISAATKAASFIPVYGTALSVGLNVVSAIGSLFGKGHVTRNKFYADVQVSAGGVTLLRRYGNSDARKIAPSSNLSSDPITAIGNVIIDLTRKFGGAIAPFVIGGQYHQKYNALGVSIGRAIVPKQGSDIDINFGNQNTINNGTLLAFILAVQRGYVKLPNNLNAAIAGQAANMGTAQTLMNTLVAKFSPEPVAVPKPVSVPAPVSVTVPPPVIQTQNIQPQNPVTNLVAREETKIEVKKPQNNALLIGGGVVLLALLARKK